MRHLGIELGTDGEFKSVLETDLKNNLEKDLKPDSEQILISES